MKILKFPVQPIPGWQSIEMPADARILKFYKQSNRLVLWAAATLSEPKRSFDFWLGFTGEDMPEARALGYVGTVQIAELVYHLFGA